MPGPLISPADQPARLLADYAARARSRVQGSLAETALRTRSVAMRHVLAAVASPAPLSEIIAAAHRRERVRLAPEARPLTDLARVLAMQRILPSDEIDGLALLDLALDHYGADRIPAWAQGLHAQLAYHLGDPHRAAGMLDTYPAVPTLVRTALRLDLANPFRDPAADPRQWLDAFPALFPPPGPQVAVAGPGAPFDRLAAPGVAAVDGDPTVSVIVTTFRPDAQLITAVRSLVQQSWRNLEVIIVDDGSPVEFDPVLVRCRELDPRVRLVRLPVNRGTYVARNAGLDAAAGAVVTFQDSDDWSHPERIAHQVRPLLADRQITATTSGALRVAEDLTITRPGRPVTLAAMSSLMFRRVRVLSRIGYFDSVRKAADTEYARRIAVVFGENALLTIPGGNYGITRVSAGSLSDSEITGGWIHPARAAYRSAYGLWHQRIRSGGADPYLPSDLGYRPFAAPAHLRLTSAAPARYDVVFASDWRPYGGPQKSMLEEIAALTRCGMSVGVLQLEAARFMSRQRKPLCPQVQDLINGGVVDQVLMTDDVQVGLLVIRYPPVLQFPPSQRSAVRAERVMIVANQAPCELDGTDQRYVPAACHDVARQLFGVEPLWCPQGPTVRDMLASRLEPAALAPFDLPGIIDPDRWRMRRTGFRSTVPVIGRHSRDNWIKWPGDRATLLRAYPNTLDVDVRIMGGAEVPRKVLGADRHPPNWLVYGYDEVTVRSFLSQIDFYVYFPHPVAVEAFGRAILEALAAGCVTILPPVFARTFGDAAVYCQPDEVRDVMAHLYADPDRYLARSRAATAQVRQRFGHGPYVDLVRSLLGEGRSADMALPVGSVAVST